MIISLGAPTPEIPPHFHKNINNKQSGLVTLPPLRHLLLDFLELPQSQNALQALPELVNRLRIEGDIAEGFLD